MSSRLRVLFADVTHATTEEPYTHYQPILTFDAGVTVCPVTDHRIGLSAHDIDGVLGDDPGEIIETSREEVRKEQLAGG